MSSFKHLNICSALAIAVGWILYRPLVGIALLLVAVAALYALFHFRKRPIPATQMTR